MPRLSCGSGQLCCRVRSGWSRAGDRRQDEGSPGWGRQSSGLGVASAVRANEAGTTGGF